MSTTHEAALPRRRLACRSIVYGNVDIPQEALDFGNLLFENYIPRALNIPVYPDKALERLDMPVLFIGGEKDQLINITKSAERLKRLVPHAQIQLKKELPHALINMGHDIAVFLDAHQKGKN